MQLTEEQRREAQRLGISERAAGVAIGLGITLEQYAARRSPPASTIDEASTQAHMYDELAQHAGPGARARLQTMADEARARVAQLRAARGGRT